MINPIKLYLGLAALVVTVTAVVSVFSSEDEEVQEVAQKAEPKMTLIIKELLNKIYN